MGDVVNLRSARKCAKRRRQDERAAENRTAFGRSRTDRRHDAALRDKAERDLDQHRMETGDDR